MSESVDCKLWNLPPDYSYYQSSINNINDHSFGIKEVKDKDSAEEWLKAYSLFSNTTWRVERTYKCSGKFVYFKKDYRCCHFTDRRVRGIRSSKHTGCPAKLCIVVKRYIENANKPDMILKTYPCHVRIKNIHNHSTKSVQSLTYQDLNIDVKPILYMDDVGQDQTGFNFSSQSAEGELFCKTKENRSKKDLLNPIFNRALTKNVGTGDSLQISTALENKQTVVSEELENIGCDNNVHISSVHGNADRTVNEITEALDITGKSEQSEAISQVKKIFDRIEKGIHSNPDIFLPAVNKMLKNASTFAASETGLINAMNTFATNPGVQNTLQCKCPSNYRSCRKTIIRVQPAAVAQRKYSLADKINISAGRPQVDIKSASMVQCRSYTIFRHLP